MIYDHGMMIILNSFAKRVRLMRDEADMSQEDLVEAMAKRGVSVSQGHWSRIERGKVNPSSELVAAAAKVLGVSADYLLCLHDNPYPPTDEADHAGISEEAEMLASLVDDMPTESRHNFVTIAQAMAEADASARSRERRRAEALLNLVRVLGGDEAYRQAVAILNGDLD